MKHLFTLLVMSIITNAMAIDLPSKLSVWQWESRRPSFSVKETSENGSPVFKVFGPVIITSKEYFPVTPKDKFRISYELKTTGFPTEFTVECFDKNKKQILPVNVLAVADSGNTLCSPIKKGSKVIRVKANDIWKKAVGSAVAFDTKEDSSDLPNFNTAMIKSVRTIGDMLLITLETPCPAAYQQGTQVRLHHTKSTVTEEKFQAKPVWLPAKINTVVGAAADSNVAIYPGTAFIRLKLEVNARALSRGQISYIKNIKLEKFEYEIKLLSHSIVADKYPDYRLTPSTIIRKHNGDLLAIYVNRGDVDAGCCNFFAISKDNGKSWAKAIPYFVPDSPQWGHSAILYRQPDGKMIAAITKAYHKRVPKNFFTDSHKNRLREYLELELHISHDDGETFEFLQKVGNARYRTITASGNTLLELPNGDWILPVWAYGPQDKKDAPQGSGFIRSTDKGKTWGDIELAFQNDPAKGFNENVFTITPDGKLVAFARFDRGPRAQQFLHKVVSTDNGKTWSKPEPTPIVGIWPSMVKLKNGLYVLFCGVKTTKFNTHEPHIFLSRDGENFQDMGPVYYSRPFGWNGKQNPKYWGTGSGQCIAVESDNSFYLLFEGADIAVKSGEHAFGLRYIDFNRFQADFIK